MLKDSQDSYLFRFFKGHDWERNRKFNNKTELLTQSAIWSFSSHKNTLINYKKSNVISVQPVAYLPNIIQKH